MNHQKPVVKLVDYTNNPFNLSIATARTCYSSRGILSSEDMVKSEKSIEIRDRVAKSTKKAGHLTTRQHPQFIFTLDKVSRQFVWSFLHSHPFYNSEQVSQRYVEVKPENYYIPPSLSDNQLKLYLEAIEYATGAYFEFIEILKPFISKEYFEVFSARKQNPDKWQDPIKKRCLEVARYLLPLATHTYLYHTINGLTLHRYYRLMNSYDVPEEQSQVVREMINAVKKIDPLFADEMDDPIPLEKTSEFSFYQNHFKNKNPIHPKISEFINEFDSELGNRFSRLVSYSENSPKVLADSLRSILGIPRAELSNTEAIQKILSPEFNSHLTSTLNETTLSPISRALFQVHYSFQKKISHTADSQDQRHRMVPGSRPVIMSQYSGKADFITPSIIKKYSELNEKYLQKMDHLFKLINRFLENSKSSEYASYLLPNAFPIRFYESGDLLNLHHKWKSRLCYNAQEEIFHASCEEVSDVYRVHPEIASWIKAPCWIRFMGEERPYCPEGDKFCGVQVWKKESLNEYQRTI